MSHLLYQFRFFLFYTYFYPWLLGSKDKATGLIQAVAQKAWELLINITIQIFIAIKSETRVCPRGPYFFNSSLNLKN